MTQPLQTLSSVNGGNVGGSDAFAGIPRKTYARTPTVMGLPRLTEVQLRSFEWFRTEGLRELFEEISPIVSFNKNLELHLGDFHFGEPKYPEDECRERDITF